ncbi:MAG: gluconate 2-dehydrogenase subunit 3 family protein [Actinomycetota bacterium]|nr:gluconate 2-dehydrogenase subunit 3 family protein [Actinomycetota bacterium]
MTALPLQPASGGGRFPGFSTASQARHWDEATAAVVIARLGLPQDLRYFTPVEEAAARALFDQLLDQREDPRVPIVNMVDARLAEDQTDGWHYDGMKPDGESWRASLSALDEDAFSRHGVSFCQVHWDAQTAILTNIQDAAQWHEFSGAHIWSLWTRYACTAFYSHPAAWDEIGFAGPAYPRGYKNLGLDSREPFEVADVRPQQDPLRPQSAPGAEEED